MRRNKKKKAVDLDAIKKKVEADYKESEAMKKIRQLMVKLDADVRRRVEGAT